MRIYQMEQVYNGADYANIDESGGGACDDPAQCSAAAAKEVKTLITDSVEQVEAGGQLVSQARGIVSAPRLKAISYAR